MEQKTTGELLSVLKKARPEEAARILEENSPSMVSGETPFTAYMRSLLREKNLSQQKLFLDADMPERYGYKLISGEKHTRQRDHILRLCCAGGLTLAQTQRALALYGLPGLYARSPRDAVLIIAFNTGCKSVQRLDALLAQHGMEPLHPCGEAES